MAVQTKATHATQLGENRETGTSVEDVVFACSASAAAIGKRETKQAPQGFTSRSSSSKIHEDVGLDDLEPDTPRGANAMRPIKVSTAVVPPGSGGLQRAPSKACRLVGTPGWQKMPRFFGTLSWKRPKGFSLSCDLRTAGWNPAARVGCAVHYVVHEL
jgi:hypothetical protein